MQAKAHITCPTASLPPISVGFEDGDATMICTVTWAKHAACERIKRAYIRQRSDGRGGVDSRQLSLHFILMLSTPQTAKRKSLFAVAKHDPVVGGEPLARHDALYTKCREEKYVIDEEAVQNQEVRQCTNGLRIACEISQQDTAAGA
jgi:hypothetical protein